MKKINILLFVIVSFLAMSCFKDLGNYTYTDSEVITITGIESTYNAMQMVDSLTITPTVTSNIAGAEFEYYYAIYETNVQGYVPVLDTIQRSGKDLLKYPVTRKSMTYGLVFWAKDIKTGVTGTKTSVLNVITQFNNGWYVIKDVNNKTDMDLFDTTGHLAIQNVLLSVNGIQLNGKAEAISYTSNYSVYDSGTAKFTNTKTIFPVATEDAATVVASTGVIVKDFTHLFYDEISVPYSPKRIFGNSQGIWIINNGKVHSIYTMSSNAGIFGTASPVDVSYSPYYLSKYTVNHAIYGPLGFDELSSTFYALPYGGGQLVATKDAAGTDMSVKNNNKSILYMGSRGSSGSYFFSVLQDKTNPSLKMITKGEGFTNSTGPTLKFTNDTLLSTDAAYNATLYTSSQSLDILYFVSGDKLYMRNVASKKGANVLMSFTIPSGETATFIKHIPAYSTTIKNNFMLGTQSGTTYKVRIFNLTTTGDITGNAVKTFSGTGRAGDIIYIFPTLSYGSYPVTY